MTPRLLLFAGYASLVVAWIMANPPGAAPDEYPHYLRALAVGGGDVIGADPPRRDPSTFRSREEEWTARTERLFTIPGGLARESLGCNRNQPLEAAGCTDDAPVNEAPVVLATNVGTYPPYLYAPAGFAARLASSPEAALRIGRVALAAISLGMIALTVVGPARAAFPGALVTLTPMVVFTAATLSPSAVEVPAGAGLAAGTIALTRPASATRARAAWTVVGISGTVLALSRPLGPVWAALLLVLLPALLGFRAAVGLVRRDRAAVVALVAIGAGAAATLAWEAAYEPGPPGRVGSVVAVVGAETARLPALLGQAIGKFGYLDSPMPWPAIGLWAALLATVVVAAVVAGTRRQRIVVCGSLLVVGVVTLGVAVRAAVDGADISYMQARWVLALLVGVPLLAGEIVARAATRLGAAFVTVAAVGAGVMHVVAFMANARRHAVGLDGPLWFPGAAAWSPPLGWWPWLVVAIAGGVAVAVAGVIAARHAP